MEHSDSSEGTWRSDPSDEIPQLELSVDDRLRILREIAELFSRWVIEGRLYDVSYADDPPWDHSGKLIKIDSTPDVRLGLFPTLGRWADEAYTGISVPTCLSGMGLAHQTYDEEIENVIRSGILAIWTRHLSAEEREAFLGLEPESTAVDLTFRLIERACDIRTDAAWEIGEPGARECILRDSRERERRWSQDRDREARVESFWKRYLSDIPPGFRIDASNAQLFMERLGRILDLADPEDLEALKQKGLPGNFSKSVQERIRRMAADKQCKVQSRLPTQTRTSVSDIRREDSSG
jgi:hypothetical protein